MTAITQKNKSEFLTKGGASFHIATLKKEPEWFLEKFNFNFEMFSDDLYEFKAALLARGEKLFVIQQYLNRKGKGVELLVNKEMGNKREFLRSVLREFQLEEKDISWKHASAGGILVREFMEQVKLDLENDHSLMQILTGPRQVGKTTGADYIIEGWKGKTVFASADGIEAKSTNWITRLWAEASQNENTLLVIDEIQKVDGWDETIKMLWDKQKTDPKVRLLLLGSNSLSMNKNIKESLAGRYFQTYVPHWSFEEYKTAFETSLDDYLLFGGYPGAAKFIGDYERWYNYLSESIIKPVVTIDIPSFANRESSMILRFLEILGRHLGKVTSYRKLADEFPKGTNSKVVSDYLELFEGVFFCKRINKFSEKNLKRSSSPQLLPLFTSFLSYFNKQDDFKNKEEVEAYLKVAIGQRLFESKIGELSYWKEGRNEVDFVYKVKGNIFGIQVSDDIDSIKKDRSSEKFRKEFKQSRVITLGKELFQNFSRNPESFLERFAT